MRPRPTLLIAVGIAAALALPARAQQPAPAYDPVAIADGVRQLLSRTPDREIDGLFHALHGAMREPREADAICGLFEDGADRGFEGLNRAAMQLGESSRQRFVDAIAYAVVAGLEGQPQTLDRAAAEQALKSNGARAAMLHDGFSAGLVEGATRQARCTTLGQMLDVLAQRPQAERVLVTRLLLEQGLVQAVRLPAARGR
jgi:hypothetical protein